MCILIHIYYYYSYYNHYYYNFRSRSIWALEMVPEVAARGVLMAARGNDSAGGEDEGSSYVHRATEQSARSSAECSLPTIHEEMEKVALAVQIPTTPEIPLEYARGRIKTLCLQNGINLQQQGCADIWEYCRNKRQLGHGAGQWWPKGPEAWMFAQCSAYVECWLWAEACGSWETGQPLSHSAYSKWWPVLVGLPCPPPDDDRFAYVCPALAARSSKCWWGHRTRLVLAASRGPPPPPQRPPPRAAPPLPPLPPPTLQRSGSGSAAPTYVPSSAAPSEVSTAVPSTQEPSSPAPSEVSSALESWIVPEAPSNGASSSSSQRVQPDRRWGRRRHLAAAASGCIPTESGGADAA